MTLTHDEMGERDEPSMLVRRFINVAQKKLDELVEDGFLDSVIVKRERLNFGWRVEVVGEVSIGESDFKLSHVVSEADINRTILTTKQSVAMLVRSVRADVLKAVDEIREEAEEKDCGTVVNIH